MKKLIIIAFVALTFALGIDAQEAEFISGTSGFKILRPPGELEESVNTEKNGDTEVYLWARMGEYYYEVRRVKMDMKPKLITPAFKEKLYEAFILGIRKSADKDGGLFSQSEIFLNKEKGREVKILNQTSKIITRCFVFGNKLYTITGVVVGDESEDKVIRILNSFRLLSREEIIAQRIKEATPEPLPQERGQANITSDLEHDNIKGKVKKIEVSAIYPPSKKTEKTEEYTYDRNGLLIGQMDFSYGFPVEFQAWGFLDNDRVVKINYTDVTDLLPPSGNIFRVDELPEEPPKDASIKQSPPDFRYDVKFRYKYDDMKRLAEMQMFDNIGRLTQSDTISYFPGRKIRTSKFADETIDKTEEILDINGNAIEARIINSKGKTTNITYYTYKYDERLNWIEKRTFEKKKAKGKQIEKTLNTEFRTITYYG